jgi:pimeloyl-ACP methyl ester carboxylesterase
MTDIGSPTALPLTRRAALGLVGALPLVATGASQAFAKPAPVPIDQSLFIPAGGLKQWIHIRGDDRRNPVILVVHGGPGEAQWPVAEHYRAWEQAFTVVQWDQRGAGHTYGLYGDKTPDMTLKQFAADGIDVADYLRRTLGKRRIIVLGHSWGSCVAVMMAHNRPDLFAAYVGTGQVEGWKATVNTQFDFLLAKARKEGDAATVKELEAIGRPNLDPQQFFHFTRNMFGSAWAPSDREWVKGLRADAPRLQAAYPKDFKDFSDGFQFSVDKLLAEEVKTDLPVQAPDIGTAVFIIQGADDIISPRTAAEDYFRRVRAPKKELVLIPGAGHFAFMTAPAVFLAALTDKVRPVAIARGA